MKKNQENLKPIVHITLLNYDPAKHQEYSDRFMEPIVLGIMERMQHEKLLKSNAK